MPGVARDLVRGAVSVAVGNGASKLLLLALEALFARLLGPEGYGYYAISYACLYVAVHVSILGLNHGVIQYIEASQAQSGAGRQGRLVGAALLLALCAGSVVGLMIGLGSEWMAKTLFDKPQAQSVILILAIAVPIETLNLCLSATFRGLRRYTAHNLVLDLWRNVTMLSALPLIWLFGATPEFVAASYLAGASVGLIWGIWRIRGYLGKDEPLRWSAAEGRIVMRFSYPLIASNVMQMAARGMTVILAGMFLSAEETGAVALVTRFLLILAFVQGVVNMTAPVEFVKLNRARDYAALGQVYRVLCQILLVAASFVAIPLMLAPEWLLMFSGQAFAEYSWIVLPLVLGRVLDVASGPGGQLLIAARLRWETFTLTAIEATVQLSICLALVQRFGLAGLVWGELGRIAGAVLLRQAVVRLKLGVRTFVPAWVFLAFVLFASVACGAIVASQMPSQTATMAAVLTAYLVFGMALAGYILKTPEIGLFLKGFWSRVRRRRGRP